MSVVGVDLGTLNTVIAVARNRGVDVVSRTPRPSPAAQSRTLTLFAPQITNEVSNRATPTLVGFGPKSRYIGEAAKTQEISNLKNTVGSLKRLAGRSLKDPDVQIEQDYVSAPLIDVDGQVGAEVTYMGRKERFTATQLLSMFLSKVKATATAELRASIADVVISVPAWFTDAQRRSVIDAAEISGLKLLRLINDTTATALGYGITKTDLPPPEERPRRVAFVDIGHSSYACSVVEFRKGELAVKSTACDRHFGGRNFDKALVDHFAAEFKERFKIDIKANAKALVRVAAAAEKLKKVLSANASAPLNIESLMNDVDVSSLLTRDELEVLVKPLLDRATAPLEQALAEAKLKPEDIDAVELVGGCTRVPSLKERIHAFFGKPLSFTLNQDEAVARGCAFSCAMNSLIFRVRDFSVHDIVSYPIEFTWEQSPEIPDEDTSLTVFNKGNLMPSTKILTFYRKQPFDLESRYARPDTLPGKMSPWIGRFSIKNVKADSKDDFMICKLKTRLNLHGVLNIEQGYYVEEVEVEEPVPDDKAERKDGDAMDTDPPDGAEAKPKTRKVKKQVKRGDLPVVAATASLDPATKAALAEKEMSMFMEDKLVADTEDKKNELESYIYEMRGKIDDQFADFASDEEKEKLKAKLEEAEDWLYGDGEDATKAVYTAKMDEIRFLAGPIAQRYMDKVEEDRQASQRAREEADAARRAEREASKKVDDEAKKGSEAAAGKDEEMRDAETAKPDSVEEAGGAEGDKK
ncbi:MAG: adenyl-nucleotide exchange factor sse1 [Thelocarpon impressellum]|nr:MAG: adenyl-nucleotide exchange factor sse1 [Thelocarpon impressellum]